MRDLRFSSNAGNIVGIRIPERFKGKRPWCSREWPTRPLRRSCASTKVVSMTEVGKRMRAADCTCRRKRFSALRYALPPGQRLDGVGDGRRPGHGQRGASPFQARRCASRMRVLRGVGKTAVDVPSVRQIETSGSMLAIVENVRSGLVDRDRSRAVAGSGCSCPTWS